MSSDKHSMTIRFRENSVDDMTAYEFLRRESEQTGASKNSIIIRTLCNASNMQAESGTYDGYDRQVDAIVAGVIDGLSKGSISLDEFESNKADQEQEFCEDDLKFIF